RQPRARSVLVQLGPRPSRPATREPGPGEQVLHLLLDLDLVRIEGEEPRRHQRRDRDLDPRGPQLRLALGRKGLALGGQGRTPPQLCEQWRSVLATAASRVRSTLLRPLG